MIFPFICLGAAVGLTWAACFFSDARGVTAEQANPRTFGIFPPDSPSKHAIPLKNTEEEAATICFV